MLLAYCKCFIILVLTSILILAGATGAKEEATKQDALQQGVELLFPIGTGKQEKGVKLSKEQKKAASLLKKLKAIEKGGNVNAVDKFGQTALMYAAAQDNQLAICWLIAKGADVTLRSEKGKKAEDLLNQYRERQGKEYESNWSGALLHACEAKPLTSEEKQRIGSPDAAAIIAAFRDSLPHNESFPQAVQMLQSADSLKNVPLNITRNAGAVSCMIALMVRKGVNLKTDVAANSPLLDGKIYADERDNLRLAISLGLDPRPQEMEPKSLMRYALLMNNNELLKQCIEKNPELANDEQLLDFPFSAKTASMLLKMGKLDLTNQTTVKKVTHQTLYAGDAEKLRILLKAGLNIDKNKMLQEAITSHVRDCAGVIPALLEAGADSNMTSYGEPVLFLAARENLMVACEQLLDKGARLKDEDGNSLLHAIALSQFRTKDKKDIELYAKLVKRCIDAGIDVNAPYTNDKRVNPEPPLNYILGLRDVQMASPDKLSPEAGKAALTVVQMLLKAGAKVSEDALTSLDCVHYPVDVAEELALLLIDHGANANDERSLIRCGGLGKRIARRLLDSGLKVEGKDFPLNSLPMTAEAAEVFIQAGARVPKDIFTKMLEWTDGTGIYNTPDVEELKKLVHVFADAGADLQHALTQKYKGMSYQGHYVLKVLLESGADPNATDEQGNSALMLFIASTTVEDVAAFLDAGADVSHKNKAGKSVLQLAKEKKQGNEIIKLLKEHGAKEEKVDPNAKDKEGRTPLMRAALDPDGLDRLKECIAQKGDVNARDNKGCTALRLLFGQDGDINSRVSELLNAKADVNLGDSNDFTPLMVAACYKDAAKRRFRVQRLINAKANVNAAAKMGNTAAMHLLLHYDDPDTLRMLLDAGAKPDHKNSEGKTMLDIASENHRSACIKLLNERFPASAPGHQ